MKFRSFRHSYHDGQLARFVLGPRRELTLDVVLDPIWNKEVLSANLRFGGIENYEEVAKFFQALPMPRCPGAYIAEIIGLEYMKSGPNWVIIDLAEHGHVTVHSHHVTES